ncbi:MAG: glycerate kinase, partial [Dehalococcoidia bacterium]|nr:glycerate kinase [Dehalococcoidia bacterium]
AGLRRALPKAELDLMPMADGGPGTVDVMLTARGGERRTKTVTGPMGEPVEGYWGRFPDGSAVLEMAAAAGIALVKPADRDPEVTTTYGCGELLRAALDEGCREFIFGLGGSVTIDGAAGLAQALGYRLLDRHGRDLRRGGRALLDLDRIDASDADPRLGSIRMHVACDVETAMVGEHGTVQIFGPQKGATQPQIVTLEAALRRLAAVVLRDLGVDMLSFPAGGPGGGMAAGLAAFARGELEAGGLLIADWAGLEAHMAAADVCVTGEGSLDYQTTMGKSVSVVAGAARRTGVPCYALAGRIGERATVEALSLAGAWAVTPPGMAWDEAKARAAELLADAAERLGLLLLSGRAHE